MKNYEVLIACLFISIVPALLVLAWSLALGVARSISEDAALSIFIGAALACLITVTSEDYSQ
mgnify:CR=1 FL=1